MVSGAVNIASGAQLGLRLTSLLTALTSYTVITGGTLTAGTINQDLLSSTPYMYVATSRDDTNNVYRDVRQRTASETGMNKAQTYLRRHLVALSKDKDTAAAYLAQSTKDGYLGLYDQMMPDQGEGFFAAMQDVTHAISTATAFRPDPGDRYGPDSLWAQEINTLVRRDTDESMAFGHPGLRLRRRLRGHGRRRRRAGPDPGSSVSIEEHDIAAKVGEQTTGNFVQLVAY